MNHLVYTFFIALLACSCTERKQISVTFVFDKPLSGVTKYPDYFKDVVMPFISECQQGETEFLLKPINISRLDVSNREVETNAWHFENMGDNTVDFSKLWLEQYFKDSLIHTYLLEPSKRDFNVDNWITSNAADLYIYSEEAQASQYKEKTVFASAKELNSAIRDAACSNTTGKIWVLVNPNLLSNITNYNPPTQQDEGNGTSNNAGHLKGSSSGDINAVFSKLTDMSRSDEERFAEIESILSTYFAKSATVEEYGTNRTRVAEPLSVRDYLEKLVLYRTVSKVEVMDAQKDNTGKYWNVKVIEHHNTVN